MTTAPRRHRLAQAERDVTRAGRHVDDQVIEVAPADLAKELLNGAVDHGPRQITAWSSPVRKASETTCRSYFSAGLICFPSVDSSVLSPSISGTLGP